ncbi:MAG: hypothetical protein ACYS0G_13420 [Planctomycetota bacterium]|jgi:hypothetical protein
MKTVVLFLTAGLLIGGVLARPAPRATAPVSVFAALDGTWVGTFVGYDSAGREVTRIAARHTYRTVDETQQTVEIEDTMPDGSVVRGQGVNVAERADDGSLRLRCIITKTNGESVEHQGRLVRGPDGDEQIIWHTNRPDRTETFRERVRGEGGDTIYEINGMGRYGKRLMLMAGRYRMVE